MSDVDVGPSAIEGLGVFARRAFGAGERIRRVRVVREVTAASPIRKELGERVEHCAYPDGKILLLGGPFRHLNHSCDPNAYEQFSADGWFIVARRSIERGAEITVDYNINITGGTSWPCHCGSARCRNVVAGDFFLLPVEWRREYRPYLAEWFVNRHRERLAAFDRL
jgi:SET domain-containing protein